MHDAPGRQQPPSADTPPDGDASGPQSQPERLARPRRLSRPFGQGSGPRRVPFRPVGAPLRPGHAASHRAPRAPRPQHIGWLSHLWRTIFIDDAFAKLWWGMAISTVGDYAWDTALVLWIAAYLAPGQSWAPLAVSGVILAAAIPQIVAGPVAGVFVDRWDKRRTIVVMSGLQALFAALLMLSLGPLALPFLNIAHLPVAWQLGIIYADVAILTVCAQFSLPAQLALVKDIVPPDKQDQALETTQAVQGLSVIIGPPVAAALVFGLGVQWALGLNALSFVVAFVAVAAIAAPPAAHSLAPGETGHFSREFLDGLGYVTGHVVLRTILVSEMLTWLGFGALQSLGYFFITQNLHTPASDYGIFGAVFGIGAIGGALLVTIFGQRIGLARLLWIALVASGAFVMVMSHLSSFAPALVAAFVFGVAATAIIVTASPLALHGTSREYVGRVMAVINPLGRLAALVSVALAAYLVSNVLRDFHAEVLGITFGPVDSVFTGMGLLAIAGGIYARISLSGLISAERRHEEHVPGGEPATNSAR